MIGLIGMLRKIWPKLCVPCKVLAAFSGETPTFEDKEKLLTAVKPRH